MNQVPDHELTAETVETAARDFERAGCLVVRDLIKPELLEPMLSAVEAESSNRTEDALVVGDGRRMSPVTLEGPMFSPALFADDQLLALLRSVLGDRVQLAEFTCVSATPGAAAQHQHRDSIGLFGNPVDFFCPSFAVNLFIPLIPLGEDNGATIVWPGTHRDAVEPTEVEPAEAVQVPLDVGSVMLLDYRVVHAGGANRSSSSRPMLCLVYTRDWFLDTHHFRDADPLVVGADGFDTLDPERQRLLARATIRRT